MEYLIVISIIFLGSLCSVCKDKTYKVGMFVSFILILLAGTRYETGNDWTAYLSTFNSVALNNDEQAYRMEPGYIYINELVHYFGGELWVVFFIMALLTIGVFYFSLNIYTPFIMLGLLLYCRYGFFQFNLMFIRQGLGVSIFFLSLKYIYSRSLLKYITSIVVACFFHVSLLICLPLYFFLKKKFNILFILFTLFIALFLGQLPWLEFVFNKLPIDGGKLGAIKSYVFSPIWGQPKLISFSFFEKIIVIGISLIYYKKLEESNKYFIMFFNLAFLSFITTLVFSNYLIFVERLAVIFNISFTVLIGYFLYLVSQRDRLIIIIILGSVVSFWTWKYMNKGDTFLPYKSVIYNTLNES